MANSEHVRKYLDRVGEDCFADTRPSESKRRLPEAARDQYEILEQFRCTCAADLPSFRLIDQIFEEPCTISQAKEPMVEVNPPCKQAPAKEEGMTQTDLIT